MDPELRRNIGMNAHKEVWNKFSMRKQVEEIRMVLLSLVENGQL